MEQELNEIAEKKKQKKLDLYKLKAQYLNTIYKGYVKKKSAKEIASELYDMTVSKKSRVFDPVMYVNAMKLNKSVARQLPSEKLLQSVASRKYPAYKDSTKNDGDAIALLVYGIIASEKVGKRLTKNISSITNDYEEKQKDKMLDKFIKDNEGLAAPKVVYLASSHNDCAEDHQKFQGKMYYDENYKKVLSVLDDADSVIKQLETYIRANNLMSIQEAISKPNYFITRPNCRHYLTPLYVEEVLNKSVATLTKNYHTHRQVGNRQYLQTMKSGKRRKLIGEKRNAELMIEKYTIRKEEHELLYKSFKSMLVKRAIEKDILLIKKWTEYYNKL